MRAVVMVVLLGACVIPPELPPSQAAAAADLVRAETPPLYRRLYDYAFLPAVQTKEQRVRLRIFFREMAFDLYQIGLLEEVHAATQRERVAVAARNAEIVAQYEPEVGAVYDELWRAMDAGADAAALAAIGDKLAVVDRREAELLDLRSASVRTILDLEQTFLGTLSQKQDVYFADAIFALRHRLDPWANPGDFHELVGTVYVAGEFGTLTRATYDPAEDHLNIGGLWSPEPEKLAGPYFQDARRDVILYMLLLEPAFAEALAAVKAEGGGAALVPRLAPVVPAADAVVPPAEPVVPAAPTAAPVAPRG